MLNILIIDDDEGDRKQAKRMLKQSGLDCTVTEAGDVEEAVEACKSQTFDCALLDYQMPRFDGLAGLQALREKAPATAFIMVTGQGDEELASAALKRGASDYVPKRAITPGSVRRMIEHAVDRAVLKQKLEEQHQALQGFASILVHDLKAPLRHMRVFSGFITEALEAGDYEEAAELCERVDHAGKRMEVLIDTLNEYNKVSGAKVAFNKVPLLFILKNALENLSAIIQERGVRVTYDTLPEIVGNEPQLVQLLQNLIGNSVKYCKAETPLVHISAEKVGDSWHLSVRDNGIGIPEKFRKEIFAPFKRLHTSDEYAGTGLGLATCKKIIERHGGRIWCDSEEGKGSTFTISIPENPS